MITKEIDGIDTYCIYANDFHLEMILLPYIKNILNMKKIIIVTENNLEDSIRILLDRTNLSSEYKEKIYNLNWDNNVKNKINYIKKYSKSGEDFIVIIKGSVIFMKKILDDIKYLNISNSNIIRCYSMEEASQMNIKLDESKILKTEKF